MSIFVLSVSDIQDYDKSKPPAAPNLDFWIFHVQVEKSNQSDGHDKKVDDYYVKLSPDDYRPAEKIINTCIFIDLKTIYMGFEEPAQDGRFELDKDFISFYQNRWVD